MLVASAAVAAPAATMARTVTVTVTGTVAASTTDTLGLFGTAGADISGDSATEVFTSTFGPSNVSYTAPSGSPPVGAASLSSAVTGALTVHGTTIQTGGLLSELSEAETSDANNNFTAGVIALYGSDVQGFELQANSATPFFDLASFPSSFSFTLSSVDSLVAQYMICGNFSQCGTTLVEGVSLTPTNVSVDFSSGVPEPAAWTLMLIGFGAAGAALRRVSASPFAAGGAKGPRKG